jgi:integrase
LKTPDGVIRWITHEEASRLIDSCAPHLKPLVSFLLYTGARAGEALWLEWRNVDLNRGHVIFEKTKNGSSRGVPLHKDLVAILANLPHREGMVFRQPNGQPYSLPRGGMRIEVQGLESKRGSKRRCGGPVSRIFGCMMLGIRGQHGFTRNIGTLNATLL